MCDGCRHVFVYVRVFTLLYHARAVYISNAMYADYFAHFAGDFFPPLNVFLDGEKMRSFFWEIIYTHMHSVQLSNTERLAAR